MPSTTHQPAAAGTQPEASPREARERMAAAGDVDGLWELLCTTPRSLIDQEGTFRLLLKALEAQCRQDPARFSESVFARMASFTTYLLFRMHFFVQALVPGEPSLLGCEGKYFSRDVLEVLFPQLVALQAHLGEILQNQATTARVWQLTRQKQRQNDHDDGAKRRNRPCFPAHAHGKASSDRLPGANGVPTNRIASLVREDMGCLHYPEGTNGHAG